MHCDRCGAIARARYVLPNGQDLLFCGHHTREYHDKLEYVAEYDFGFDSEPVLVDA